MCTDYKLYECNRAVCLNCCLTEGVRGYREETREEEDEEK